MPTIRDHEDLNDLNKAKKLVAKNLMKTFRGSEQGVDVGGTGKADEHYKSISNLLSAVVADIAYMTNSMSVLNMENALGQLEAEQFSETSSQADFYGDMGVANQPPQYTTALSNQQTRKALIRGTGDLQKHSRDLLTALLSVKSFLQFNSTQVENISNLNEDLKTAIGNFEAQLAETDPTTSQILRSVYKDALPVLKQVILTITNYMSARSGVLEQKPLGIQGDQPIVGAGYEVKLGSPAYMPRRYL